MLRLSEPVRALWEPPAAQNRAALYPTGSLSTAQYGARDIWEIPV